MTAYICRRIAISIVVLLILSVVGFIGLSLAPGDPLLARISPQALASLTPAEILAKKAQYGLNLPLPLQYFKWFVLAIHGNLGYSISDSQPVISDLRTHVGPTLLLVGTALLLSIIIAVPMGVIAAIRQGSVVDYVFAALPLMAIGIPGFVAGLGVIYIFSVHLGWFPSAGMQTLGDSSLGDLAKHLVLPASVLSVAFGAPLSRYTRSGMIDALRSEYVLAARAKGISPASVILRHALRNSLVLIVTVIGLAIPDLLAGAVIIEQVFSWPGMGQLAVSAAGNRDVPLMMGIVLVVGVTVVIANLAVDVIYGLIDPRIRFGK